ncbi:MAG TPA: TlpA disulfide reductase family protein [Acidimicrobiia bacterium]|nr:TlpA disulfide reductase family protein [Acidimicrobiia bacterium]
MVGVLLAVSLHSRSKSDAVPPDVSVKGIAAVHSLAPRFTATDLDGKSVSLASYRGRPVLVSFGASWCHPCNQEYPLLVEAAAQHHDLAVLSVMHDDLPSDARQFVAKYHADWPAINDESNAISKAYGVNGIPQTFFITKDGTIQARVYGITSHKALDGPLNTLLAAA